MKKARHAGTRHADTAEGKAKVPKERGLAWGSSSFKDGVLTLKKSEVTSSKERLNTKIMLGGGKLAGSDRPKGGRGRALHPFIVTTT